MAVFFVVNNLQMEIGGPVGLSEFNLGDWKSLTAVHINEYFYAHNGNLGVIVSQVLIDILRVIIDGDWKILTYQHPELVFLQQMPNQ